MDYCPNEDKLTANGIDHEDLAILKEQLEYFMRLAQAQAKQIKQYKELQQRSHRLINSLTKPNTLNPSWKK